MQFTRRILTTSIAGAALALTAAPAALAAPTTTTEVAPMQVQVAQDCPAAEDFHMTAPSHTEVGGDLLDKQITFGAYWTGGNLPAGSQLTLEAGDATVTLADGRTYEAPVVAGGTISGIFPGGGAAFAPSFRLADSSRFDAQGATGPINVAEISYPVTVTGAFGTCTYEVHGTATSKFNVTSIELREG